MLVNSFAAYSAFWVRKWDLLEWVKDKKMKTLCLTMFLLSLAGVGDSAEYLPVKGKENPWRTFEGIFLKLRPRALSTVPLLYRYKSNISTVHLFRSLYAMWMWLRQLFRTLTIIQYVYYIPARYMMFNTNSMYKCTIFGNKDFNVSDIKKPAY